ncbi:MAG TPA: outer membrane protein assembly factor BamD [Gelidibacter sp.]|uniref:outer membrane protein assembly factor BamD n=1 Tax=Gelidibacter sp. TaxID=2018083 RepID=UPI002B6C4624|nr:outer membrane protein assembly factor BamD [Gelidibacter sp.]HXJ99644.1 outer membrane protein assembly factor BamD [Gelidibacter sp.]
MKNIFYTLLITLVLSSCSEYQKALKSEDIATKFKLGSDLYDAGKFSKANKLFAQIAPQYRGKPQAEKLMYMYSNSFYQMKDYYMAGYQFERFEGQYPKSEKAEEALFMSAKSFSKLSPVYSKEQKETITAIEKLQLFINKYPDSEYLSEANAIIQELDYKLEKKAFEIAKLYNKIANFESEDYEASIKAFDNFLLDYPGSSFREEAMFYRFDSAYKLGINSVEYRREERINIAIKHYNAFNKAYPESQHNSEASTMINELQTAILAYTTKS